MGVAPGGGGLYICPGGLAVKFGEKRADFLEDGLRLLLPELPESVRVWPRLRALACHPAEEPLCAPGIPLRGSCWFRTPGVLEWRGVLGRRCLGSYGSLSEELFEARIDSFVALLGTGAAIISGEVFLPIPARAM